MADTGGEQHCAGRPAVPAVVRLLADLRPDAHSQPDARRVLHAGRLFRRHAAVEGGELLARRAPQRCRHGSDRRPDRALPAAPAGGSGSPAGAADAGLCLHRRRCLPDAVDRRSLAAGHAGAPAGHGAGGGPLLSALSPGDRGGRRRHRRRAVAAGRLDAARRHDPRRRRRCPDRPRRRHQGVAAVHAGVRAGRGAGGVRRGDGRALSLRLSRPRFRDAAARPDRRHPRRHRQPAGCAGRQLPDRLSLQLRPGHVSRSRLRDPVPADAADPGAAPARPVRPGGIVSSITPRRAGMAVALVLLATLPIWVGNTYYINIASQILLWDVLALALNVLVGWAGLTSLGHAGLFAMAGYTAAMLLAAGHNHFAADIAAMAVTLATTAVFAVLALRATGIGFLMITLAIGQILWGIAYRWVSLTNGDNGINVTTRPAPLGISLTGAGAFYLATLVVFLIAVATMAVFVRSPFGAALRGTRDQARRMTALGYNVWLIRFLAILFSGFWSGIAGLLFIYYNQFVGPQVVALTTSAEALLMVISG